MTTVRELSDRLRTFLDEHPDAADREVCACPPSYGSGVTRLAVCDAERKPVEQWDDLNFRVCYPGEASGIDHERCLGPYHPSRKRAISPFSIASFAFFTYRGSTLLRLNDDKLLQAWQGHPSRRPLLADGDLPLLTIVSTFLRNGVQHAYFLRVKVVDGTISPKSQRRARDSEMAGSEEKAFQLAEWPTNWREQVERQPGISGWKIEEMGFGGPLWLSLLYGIDLRAAAYILADRHWRRGARKRVDANT